jgi:hypothetical protein
LNFSFNLNPIQIQLQPLFRGSTRLQLSYLSVLKFTCKILYNLHTNRGTSHGPGRERAQRDVTHTRVTPRVAAAVRRNTTTSRRSLCVTSAYVELAHTPKSCLGRGAECHAACTWVPAAPSVRPPRTHAEGRHTSRQCAGLRSCEASTFPRAHTTIKAPSPPAREPRCPLSAIATAATVSSPLRSLPPPTKASKLLSRPHSSSHNRFFIHIAVLAGFRTEAAALPRSHRYHSPEAQNHLRASHCCQSVPGRPNRTPMPRVDPLRSWSPPANSPPPPMAWM